MLLTLGFALAAIPASATITYTYCTSGCSATGGSYAAWQAAPGASGLAFGTLTTFVSGGLAGPGIYTDSTTGTIFTNYSSGGSAATGQLIGSNFVQLSAYGAGTGIEIDLPANTYAFAMVVQSCFNGSCSSIPFTIATVGQGTPSSYSTNYSLTIPQGGPPQFFGIVSDSSISSLFFAVSSSSGQLSINSFEIGQGGAATPEAATFFTMGGGLIGLYFWRRRQPQPPRPMISEMAPAHR
jgi:hypothetical protein